MTTSRFANMGVPQMASPPVSLIRKIKKKAALSPSPWVPLVHPKKRQEDDEPLQNLQDSGRDFGNRYSKEKLLMNAFKKEIHL